MNSNSNSIVSAALSVGLTAIEIFLMRVVLPVVFSGSVIFTNLTAYATTLPLAMQQLVTVIPQEITDRYGGLINVPTEIIQYYKGVTMLQVLEAGIGAARNARDSYISIPEGSRDALEKEILVMAQLNIEQSFREQINYVKFTNDIAHKAGIEADNPLLVTLTEKVRVFEERRANGLPDEID